MLKQILLIKTEGMTSSLKLVGEKTLTDEWESGRQLSRDLLARIVQLLSQKGCELKDIDGIGFFRGPGSFTSLRIGATVANTLAFGLNIPIVGSDGLNWEQDAVNKLRAGQDETQVVPLYGSEPHITKRRK
jgi:tRNA threonylcarbamoyladenosine biosynthesis protein TsaB